jgi:SAM-dependent methyltransferase
MTALWTRIKRKLSILVRTLSGYRESEAALGQAANRYWNDFSEPERAQDAHWRGHGPFVDDAVWLRLGRNHLELLQQVLQSHGRTLPAGRVVEWGCGGGMNAVHFARGAQRYYGVDLSAATLQECARQLVREGLAGFVPVQIDANQPRAALPLIGEPCQLFICTYVFELLPSVGHALELLQLAWELLAPEGVALVQFRCTGAAVSSRSRPWGYEENMAHNVTFPLAEFRAACEKLGFVVLGVQTVDTVPELNEKNYAYVVLTKPSAVAGQRPHEGVSQAPALVAKPAG